MKRSLIIAQVKEFCITYYSQITHWPHDINHVRRVVANGKKICQLEQIKSKDAFLVELACWLHDIGRVGEEDGLLFLESNHAEASYYLSKEILKPYEKFIGRESLYKLLQAIREHNLPVLKHQDNCITRILQDADRGASLNAVGIFSTLTYLKVMSLPAQKTITSARQALPQLAADLKKGDKVQQAMEKLSFFRDWYYGNKHQSLTGSIVSPLHTQAAKKLYKPGIEEIEKFSQSLQSLE